MLTFFDQNLNEGFADAAMTMGVRMTHGSDEVYVLPSDALQTEQLIAGGFDSDTVISVTAILAQFSTAPEIGDTVTIASTNYRIMRLTQGTNHGLIQIVLGNINSK